MRNCVLIERRRFGFFAVSGSTGSEEEEEEEALQRRFLFFSFSPFSHWKFLFFILGASLLFLGDLALFL
jgi:hypothetical protein